MLGRRLAPNRRISQSLCPGRRRMSESHATILRGRVLTYSSVLKGWSLTRIHGSSRLCAGGPSICLDRALLKKIAASPLFDHSLPSYPALCAISSTVTVLVSQTLSASQGSTHLVRKSFLPPPTHSRPLRPSSHHHRHPLFRAIEQQDGLYE